MTDFLTGDDLASYLGVELTGAIDKIAELTNNLVTEEWVKNIAYAVAVRAGANPKGLTSSTRSWDDVSRTERWETGASTGVELTADEKTRLNASTTGIPRSAARSIRLRISDWNPSPKAGPWNC
jgi:hypothetical protein